MRLTMLCLISAAFVVGCGKNDGPELTAVSGTVSYKGQPLGTGMIVFFPPNGRSASGTIENGKIIDVTTENPNDGGTVGLNKISIQAITNPTDMYKEHKSLIPEKFGDPEKSGLTRTLEAGKINELKIELMD